MATDEETKTMSRLLTQGATMLRDACGDCGSPLFRYQGRVVCAACGEAKDGDDASDGGTESSVSGVPDGEDGGGTAPEEGEGEGEDRDVGGETETETGIETETEEGYRGNTTVEGVHEGEDEDTDGDDLGEVDAHLRSLAERLARDAARSADDPDEVERRLDALERTLGLLER